ncbi:K(lysine) acetyltransferase [Borealophlyctis nickersoniae]|nr:K(lysine) acetyltransferase [Borealophlyctis nickersoniae]
MTDTTPQFTVGSLYMVQWRGAPHKAKIVEKRKIPESDKYQFYVHYTNYDRRLDEWVDADMIDPNEIVDAPATVAVPEDQGAKPTLNEDRKVTRNMKRKFDEMNFHKPSEIDPKLEDLEKEREEITKIRNINILQLGKYRMNTWYFSPYPDDYKELPLLYVCEFCLKYMRLPESMAKHKSACKKRRPPGALVYEKGDIRIYEVDGKEDKLYCQNLCLLSKLFLDHKTVYYDIEPFRFYVLTQRERIKSKDYDHVLGYFSKEKLSYENYNLACYELSKIDNKIGSPELPLSDLGLVGYRSYWQAVLLDILQQNQGTQVSIKDLSLLTSIRQEDIVSTLSSMDMIRYWKGEHVIWYAILLSLVLYVVTICSRRLRS